MGTGGLLIAARTETVYMGTVDMGTVYMVTVYMVTVCMGLFIREQFIWK